MSEKGVLPISPILTYRRTSWRFKDVVVVLLLLIAVPSFQAAFPLVKSLLDPSQILAWVTSARHWESQNISMDTLEWINDIQCPHQPAPLYPKIAWNMTTEEKQRSIELFSQAVQIPSESFDDIGEPLEDPRWKPCFDFLQWLNRTFPLIHEKANIEYINSLGLLATIEGSDPSLKPLLLMSHYDVNPASPSTFDRWTHGPFSGFNDGEYVWGRGSADDKTLLVAQWEAVTHLLENGFQPRRTIILSHGFDEEEMTSRRGQGQMAPLLEERYGQNSLLMVIDEGTGTDDDIYGTPFAIPAMGEKGYLDLKITLATEGGHSSKPPAHSGIGIMSQIVNGLEENPFQPKLTTASPVLTSLMCYAKYSPNFPKAWATMLRSEGPKSWPQLANMVANVSRIQRAMVGTTLAVDVFHGGVKVNSLPELVTAMVNFRIDFAESIASTQEHVIDIVSQVAKRHGLALSAFGRNVTESEDADKYIKLELWGIPLEPAPLTPSSGGVWDLFAGTVKAAFPGPNGEERIVTPSAMAGNTDCSMYYRLSKNIYRFTGVPEDSGPNHHTVDEKAGVEAHYGLVKWLHALVQNADAYNGE